MRIAVIGAASVDVCGRPFEAPRLRDSNPGRISLSYGGVGRNIAHNLRSLGAEVKLIVALGCDANGDALYRDCLRLGIDMSLAPRIKDGSTSSYMYITDENGDMLLSLSDMDIAYNIDERFLRSVLPEINSCDAAVIDGNLSAETVRFAAENISVPLYADAVSCAKASRLRPAFGKLRAFKPNLIEAQYLTGKDSAADAADVLLGCGIERVFVSLGSDGILACDKTEKVYLPCEKITPVNLSGCGDAAAAGMIYADLCGMSLYDAAVLANHTAALAAMHGENHI